VFLEGIGRGVGGQFSRDQNDLRSHTGGYQRLWSCLSATVKHAGRETTTSQKSQLTINISIKSNSPRLTIWTIQTKDSVYSYLLVSIQIYSWTNGLSLILQSALN
jgi:hypothetical protein